MLKAELISRKEERIRAAHVVLSYTNDFFFLTSDIALQIHYILHTRCIIRCTVAYEISDDPVVIFFFYYYSAQPPFLLKDRLNLFAFRDCGFVMAFFLSHDIP